MPLQKSMVAVNLWYLTTKSIRRQISMCKITSTLLGLLICLALSNNALAADILIVSDNSVDVEKELTERINRKN